MKAFDGRILPTPAIPWKYWPLKGSSLTRRGERCRRADSPLTTYKRSLGGSIRTTTYPASPSKQLLMTLLEPTSRVSDAGSMRATTAFQSALSSRFRCEMDVDPRAVTILECRTPWREDFGP